MLFGCKDNANEAETKEKIIIFPFVSAENSINEQML